MPEATARDPRIASGADYGNPDPEWLQVDWRQQLRRVELPGAEVNYVEIGEGAPVIFVHGISGCWQNWLENLPHFGRHPRAIALDLPGFGASPMPSWPIEIPAYGRLLHDFCEKLGIERGATLVGNSMGGFVAAEAATAAPGRFDRLALVSAAGHPQHLEPGAAGDRDRVGLEELRPALRRPEGARSLAPARRLRQAALGSFIRFPDRLRADLLWEQIAGGAASARPSASSRASMIRHDIRERLERDRDADADRWGFDDRVDPGGRRRSATTAGYPVQSSRYSSAPGHVPQLERPRQIQRLLDQFLA